MKNIKKNYFIFLLIVGLLSSFFARSQKDIFSNSMSKDQLELYLSRAISMSGLVEEISCYSPLCDTATTTYNPIAYNDDLKMLVNIHARFIGRTGGIWGAEWRIPNGHFTYMRQMVQDITTSYAVAGFVKPIIQAAIYENVTTDINGVSMSDEVASTYGVTKRNYIYNNMIYLDGRYNNVFGAGQSMPDMSRLETQMWFYDMATRYIDQGIEALHLGQVERMAENDPNHYFYWDLLTKIRNYAKFKNRGLVLLDGHTFGLYLAQTDQLLFDFHTQPIRMQEMLPHWPLPSNNGGPAILTYNNGCGTPYKNTKGGKTYFGWYAPTLPYLVELDNYESPNPNTYGNCWAPWGYDEISWFAVQKELYRNDWLKYAHYKVKCLDQYAILQMPGRRGIYHQGPIDKIYRATTGYYNQEETIKYLWDIGNPNPNNWIFHSFSTENVDPNPVPERVRSSLIFSGFDQIYYIGLDQNIHGYLKDIANIWHPINVTSLAQTANQVKAKSGLAVSPDGKVIMYIGTDNYVYGFNLNNGLYSYFEVAKSQMIQQNLAAISHLLFASDSRVYYIAKETNGDQRIHGFINNGTWVTTSPTYGSQVPSTNMEFAEGALTYDKDKNRLYYVGSDGYLYFYIINNDWSYNYYQGPNSLLQTQGLKILPTKIAINGDKIFYIGREPSSQLRVHALVENNNVWNTISPSHSANIYNGQSLNSQVQPFGGEIAVSPDQKKIGYIGVDAKVYYYNEISSWGNYSYNKTYGSYSNHYAHNSLQYTDNDNLFFCTFSVLDFGVKGQIDYYRNQGSYCENTLIGVIEPEFVYNKPSLGDTVNESFVEKCKYFSNVTNDAIKNNQHHKNPDDAKLTLFPNPTNGILKISHNYPGNTRFKYFVTDVIGTKVLESTVSDDKISLIALPPGIYFVSISDGYKDILKSYKIVLQR